MSRVPPHHEIRLLAQDLRRYLAVVEVRRPDTSALVDDPLFGRVPAYVVNEARGLLVQVNGRRVGAGLEPVELGALARAETSACGHVDYADRYTWRCAEIALGVD